MINGLIIKHSNLIRMCQLELWTRPLSTRTFLIYSSTTATKNWHKSTFPQKFQIIMNMSMMEVADMSLQRMKSSLEFMVSRTIIITLLLLASELKSNRSNQSTLVLRRLRRCNLMITLFQSILMLFQVTILTMKLTMMGIFKKTSQSLVTKIRQKR